MSPAIDASEALRLLRLPEVVSRVGLRRSALYRMIAAGTFPPPVRLGRRCSVWPSHDIDAWVRARIVEARGGDR